MANVMKRKGTLGGDGEEIIIQSKYDLLGIAKILVLLQRTQKSLRDSEQSRSII